MYFFKIYLFKDNY